MWFIKQGWVKLIYSNWLGMPFLFWLFVWWPPQDIAWGQVFLLIAPGLVNIKCLWAMVSKVIWKWPQGPSTSLCLTLVTRRTRPIGKVLFLDCQLWWMLEGTRKVCVAFLHPFLLPTPDHILICTIHSGGCFTPYGVTSKKEPGVGTPTPRRGSPWGFSKL